MRRESPAYDRAMLYAVLVLTAIGLVMVMSASQIVARQKFSSPFFFLERHAVRLAVGLALMFLLMRVPYGIYRRVAPWFLVAGFVLLVALFPWGRRIRGSNRWLFLPLLNFMLQPVELAKIALIIFLSAKLAGWRRPENFREHVLPLLGAGLAMAALVVCQPNVSNAVFIILLTFTMLFIGGCRTLHLLSAGAAIIAASAPFLYRFGHVSGRVRSFLGGGADADGLGYHVDQSLIALGSGFLFGAGPGRGHQKYNFLPDAHTDFIYSIIGEELGIIGTACVLALFAFLLLRAIRAARRVPDRFGALLALGIGFSIAGTAFINMSMTLGLLPTAGLPLPFVSYGGSSLMTSLAATGILLNVSRHGPVVATTAKKRNGRRRVYARRVGEAVA
ncbi:MAG: putative lipid II flippase FtsW [Candidatus Krumholzibacteriota bacterium]|nr:putative lipid II flippase FtsW [Candidatus Krumholzibacteriota bacterium]